MAKVMTDDKHYKSIADKIRGHLNSEELMSPDVFAQKIDDVHSAGKQTAYDEFWDNYQDSGKRTGCAYMFAGRGWKDEIFNPKYSVKITDAKYMFYSSGIENLKGKLEEKNIVFDFSSATDVRYLFAESKIKYLPRIDLSSGDRLSGTFYGCYVEEMDGLVFSSTKAQEASATFGYTTELKNIKTVEGKISESISFGWSRYLNKGTITKITDVLSDDVSGKTITFNKGAKEKAFTDDEWSELINKKPNWTFSLYAY